MVNLNFKHDLKDYVYHPVTGYLNYGTGDILSGEYLFEVPSNLKKLLFNIVNEGKRELAIDILRDILWTYDRGFWKGGVSKQNEFRKVLGLEEEEI